MKTVQSQVFSSDPISLLHRKLRDPRSDWSRRQTGSETQFDDDAKTTVGYNPSQSFTASQDVSSEPKSNCQQENDDVIRKVKVEEESGRDLGEGGGEIAETDDKKKKKKRKKEKKNGGGGSVGENGGGIEEWFSRMRGR